MCSDDDEQLPPDAKLELDDVARNGGPEEDDKDDAADKKQKNEIASIRTRGKRGGKKANKAKIAGKTIVQAASEKKDRTVVDFAKPGAQKSNMWRKKLEKRRKVKHQK